MNKVIFLFVILMTSLAHAEPQYSEILPANATAQDCATKIVANMIQAGNFKDVHADQFSCKEEFLNFGWVNCTFSAMDQASTPNSYSGNIEIEMHPRVVEDPRTGVKTQVQYCRIAASCWFMGTWPFNLRNVNGTIIQHESACALNSDLPSDSF